MFLYCFDNLFCLKFRVWKLATKLGKVSRALNFLVFFAKTRKNFKTCSKPTFCKEKSCTFAAAFKKTYSYD